MNSKFTNQILAFIVWPVMNLVYSLRNIGNPTAKISMVLFSTFLGLTFVISSDTIDANSYVLRFEDYFDKGFDYLLVKIISFFTLAGEDVDFFEEIVYYVVSRFTTSPMVLFAVFATLFGYFYASNIWWHYRGEDRARRYGEIMFLAGLMIIINPNHGINQFRFWTATMIFLYGCLRFIETKNRKYFLIALLAGFVHFGLWVPTFALLIFWIFGQRESLYGIIAIISIIFSGLDFDYFSQFAGFFGEAFEKRFTGYTGEVGIDLADRIGKRVWYALYWQKGIQYASYICLYLLYKRRQTTMSPMLRRYFAFLLLLLSVFNFIGNLSMIFRYLPIYFFLFFSFMLLYIRENKLKIGNPYNVIMFLPFLLMFAIQFKALLTTTNIFVFISNPLLHIWVGNETSIVDFFSG